MTTLAHRDPAVRDQVPGAVSAPLWPLIVLVALATSVAVLTVTEGALVWRLARLLVIGTAVTGLGYLWVRPGRLGGWSGVLAGCAGLIFGIGIGLSWMLRAGLSVDALFGSIALISGLTLLVVGLRRLIRGMSIPGGMGVVLPVVLVVAVVVWTVVPALVATHVPPIGRGASPADFALFAEEVEFETGDGVIIRGWFIPPVDGETVVLRHGSGSTASSVLPQARVLARNGYGVMVTDARGHGLSGGEAMDFGWYGDQDIRAAVDFVAAQPGVDPDAIAVVGLSMGGEEAVGAMGGDYRIKAVVAEGVTARSEADKTWLSDVFGWRGWLQRGIEWTQYTITDWLTAAEKPVALADSVDQANPRPVLLITGGEVPEEGHAARHIATVADNVATWTVPGAGHTQGLATMPEEWERVVVEFLDTALGADRE